MKNFIKILATLVLAFGVIFAPSAFADSVIVALSPNGTPSHKKGEVMEALKFVTEITDLGETSTFVNALTGESFCDFSVRDKKSYSSSKAKINLNRACVGKLMKLAKQTTYQGHNGEIDYWGTLRTIVSNYNMERTDAILILGDPRYNHESEANLSMMGSHVANDSHINVDSTRSHYGMKGLEGALNGTPVHFSSEGYDWFDNTRHKDAVTRFQSLTVEYLGGHLVTASQDNAQMFERAKMGLTKPVKRYEAQYSEKLEMIYVGREQSEAAPIHEREISTETVKPSDLVRARNTEIGITWSCGACDIDIYVQPHRRADVLYYGHQRSREGVFRKDYRSASDLMNGLETVSFQAPIDLNKMMIGINYYAGTQKTVTGEIRLTLGNQTYAQSFTIKAYRGNNGRGAKQAFESLKAPSKHWVMLPAQNIVKPYMEN